MLLPRRAYDRTALAWATLALFAGAAQGESWDIPRIEESIKVDGVLDDSAWDEALVFELAYETNPGENIDPPVETECRMVYSETHLYYGCHAFDPDPDRIRARYTDRDRSFPNDDVVGLAVDPYNLNATAFVFDVNPLGVQNDRVYSEVIGRSDTSWDALWDSAGKIVDDGWVVEVRIPFAALRFPNSDGEKQTWGFNFRRYYPRDVRHRISIASFDRDNSCRLCQAESLVGFENVDQGRSLEVTPTLVAFDDGEIDEFPDGGLETVDSNVEPGLFVSWGVTPNLNLSGTLNPDFSQVEADNAQLDVNTQFALFFEERRPFFLEGANFFDSRINAVHTRTIANPDWGLKSTGQMGRNGIGILAAADAETTLLLPGAQGSDLAVLDEKSIDGIVRYRRDLGEASTVGMLVTGRDAGDYSNLVAGFDAKLRAGNNDTFTGQFLQSSTEYPLEVVEDFDQPEGSFGDHGLLLTYHHSERNWSVRTSYRDFGEDFRADLGFVPQVDFRMLVVGGRRTWYGEEGTWWTRIEAGGDWNKSETQDGTPLEEEFEVFGGITGTLQSRLFSGAEHSLETFEGVDFELDRVWISGGFQPSAWFGFSGWAASGDAIDYVGVRQGREVRWAPTVEFTPGRHLLAYLTYDRQTFDLPEGELFNAAVTEARIVYQINSRAFVRLIGQYYTLVQNPELYEDEVVPRSETLFGQLLFSYRLDARTALYLGYSSGYLDELASGLVQTDETLFLKVSYAWTP